MRKWALGAFALGVFAFVVLAAVPYFDKERDFPASITSPASPSVIDLVTVGPRQRLCMNEITIEPLSHVARFRVGTYGKPGPPLTVKLTGPGYRQTRRIAAGWPDNALQQIAVARPRAPELLRVCIVNGGKVKIALYAASDRAKSRSHVTVDGKPVRATPQFGFWEGRARSIGERLPRTVDRLAVLRGPFGHPWLVWTILALALLALTAGLAAVLWVSDG